MVLEAIRFNPWRLYWIASILSYHWDFVSIYSKQVIPLRGVLNFLIIGHQIFGYLSYHYMFVLLYVPREVEKLVNTKIKPE
jgi:hypothetical protein